MLVVEKDVLLNLPMSDSAHKWGQEISVRRTVLCTVHCTVRCALLCALCTVLCTVHCVYCALCLLLVVSGSVRYLSRPSDTVVLSPVT